MQAHILLLYWQFYECTVLHLYTYVAVYWANRLQVPIKHIIYWYLMHGHHLAISLSLHMLIACIRKLTLKSFSV